MKYLSMLLSGAYVQIERAELQAYLNLLEHPKFMHKGVVIVGAGTDWPIIGLVKT